MGTLQMNDTGPVTNGLVLLDNHVQDKSKQIRDGVIGKQHALSEEDESRLNDDLEDVNDGKTKEVQVQANGQAIQHRPQQQPHRPLVCWERFLPLRSLKVLLVENDDSTCHVVCALLRKCGYEVTAVSNGLQAWKILEDLTNHIDLILTEVVMPCLSGIGLLGKIMNHKTCKTIPVIMMSSHDSMSIVFKCLSKGAVDFLVKPIRKNELKNLWQHVWRKCHSSSGSGSESGIQTQKSTKSKSAEESGNNNGSNDEDDVGSVGLNVRNGSDNGSGTQSSWTKRVVVVDSPCPASPCDQLAELADSTCAQVIHSRPKAFNNNWAVTATRDHEGRVDEFDNDLMGKDLEIGAPRCTNLQLEVPSENIMTNIAGAAKDKLSAKNPETDDEKLDKGELKLNSEKASGELSNQAADLIGSIASNAEPQIESAVFDIPSGLSKVSDARDKVIYDAKEIPSLELSLKRLRDVGDTGTHVNERNVLRHTDLSAFSRYNSGSNANQAPTANVGSCSPLDNSSEAAKTDSMKNFQSNSNSMPPNQGSNGSSNNNDVGSTTNNAFTKPMVFSDKPTPKSSIKPFHPSSAFQPMQNGHISAPQPIIQGEGDTAKPNMNLVQARGVNQQVQVQHHHHHYHHHHHHVHKTPKHQQPGNHDDISLQNMAATAAPQCGSSNLSGEPHLEGNFYSLNGSASGSDHGSNGQNGGGPTINTRMINAEIENGISEKGGAGGGIGFRSGTGVDQNRFTQREAALNKFRQKRKERCFMKKVRYYSRKKLAEQRPRVRGQFVRQVPGNNDRDTHC
ncbi:hypothetical protein SLEP1_g37597 [Rubroshorea leprosula]|uniref:Two-component response regulator-like PRR37 n=2 Tax=Rubroshorea leprosula TaxID=152421 RepID=A0AAV5KV61_9ROSI|nr:hypothetical protein SLEP1_g37597 [Rubroshorea leprosula]